MRDISSTLKNQQGYLMIVAVILIVIVGFVGLSISYSTYSSGNAVINLQEATSAFYIAEGGIDSSIHHLGNYDLVNRDGCATIAGIYNSVGDGGYNVDWSGP